MIIKLKKKSAKFVLVLLLVFALPLLTLSKQQFRIIKENTIQYIMAMNFGFSTRVNLVDSGEGIFSNNLAEGFYAYRKQILPSIVKSVPKIIKYKLTGGDFERIDIDIKYIDYQKIMLDRDRDLKIGLLTNPTIISAKIRFRGKAYKAKLRLKGDTIGHWLSTYRMSFRIRLRGDNTILGYKSFSSQKPSERFHPYDYAYQSMMREIGNLSSVHDFAHLYVNGTDWGIMNIEEHMSKEFLEKLKRKESAIIRFSNEKFWLYEKQAEDPHSGYRISDPLLHVRLYRSGRYLQNYQYRKMYSYISKLNLNNNPSLYDADSLARAYILATAWGNWHTLTINNTRFYFNPYTLRLEPITTDQIGYKSLKVPIPVGGITRILREPNNLTATNGVKNILFHSLLPRQYINVMSAQPYVGNLSKNLSAVHNVVLDINRHLNLAGTRFPVDRKKNGAVVIDNMSRIMSHKNEYLFPKIEDITEADKGREILPTSLQASGFEEHLHVRHYADGRLELHNLIPDNVTVKDILFNGKSFHNDELVVPSYLSGSPPVVLPTQYIGIQDGKITVNTEYQGFMRQNKNRVTLVSDQIENPLSLDTAQDSIFFNKLKSGNYEFKKGEWVLSEPIVVNGNLHIPPGVRIKFSPNAYLIIKGALTAIGSIDEPITFESSSGLWKGIYVLKASERSHLKNILIKNITALEDGLLKLTGGITFYKSDVDLENVKIENVKAEDAINIVESDFTMNSVRVDNTVSDGLDIDFSRGTIIQSIFSNIGGDALDFSGSFVGIDEVKATKIKDKALSAGERSTTNIKNSSFNDIGVGIASKDGSNISADNIGVTDYRLHAAMSYVKKDFYGVPSAKLINCEIGPGDPYARQKGTNMTVDNKEIREMELDVKKLYQNEIMKK